MPTRPWLNHDTPVRHRVPTPTFHWRALLASLFQLNIKFSTVHCFELRIQLCRRHMGSKLVTASRDPKRIPNPVSSWARPGAPHSWDEAHPLSSAFEVPPPSLPPEVLQTSLSSSPNSPSLLPQLPFTPHSPATMSRPPRQAFVPHSFKTGRSSNVPQQGDAPSVACLCNGAHTARRKI